MDLRASQSLTPSLWNKFGRDWDGINISDSTCSKSTARAVLIISFQGQVSTDGDDASPETRVAKIFDQMDKNNVSVGTAGANWLKEEQGVQRSYSFFVCTKENSKNKNNENTKSKIVLKKETFL